MDFTGPFTDDAAYQENILPAMNVLDGHDVTFLAERTKWLDGRRVELKDTEPSDYFLENGVHVIRLEYRKIISPFVTDKIRAPKKLYALLGTIKPDVIFLHSIQTWAVIPVCKYIQLNKNVRLYADSHADQYNSGRKFLSRYFLHGIFYRYLAGKAAKFAEKIYYISIECGDFLLERYNIDPDKLEFLPLGGIPVAAEIKNGYRNEIRKAHSIRDNDILIIHTGKMDKMKKTVELLRAFEECKTDGLKLFLVGSLHPEIENEVREILVRDDRINFLGWKSASELEKYLCAADIYLQPGGQSATAQHALCCGLPAILADVPSHRIFVDGNGWLINDITELNRIFKTILDNPDILQEMSVRSQMLSDKYLDYRKQAKKFTA